MPTNHLYHTLFGKLASCDPDKELLKLELYFAGIRDLPESLGLPEPDRWKDTG